MKKFVFTSLAVILVAVMIYSSYQIWQIIADNAAEARIHEMVQAFRPTPPQNADEPEDEIINQSIIDLQALHPDVVGWLEIPGIRIDNPFVQYEDNDFYLRRDIHGNPAHAGTIFMDFRNQPDFTSQNTIIYGHNMRNESMFGTLRQFGDRDFFNEHRYGTIYLPNAILTLEIFAYIVIDPRTEDELYNINLSDTYFDYVQQNARHFRDIGLTADDRIVTLSTCVNDPADSRRVLLARVR